MKVLESQNPSRSLPPEIPPERRIRIELDVLANHNPQIWLALAVLSVFSLLTAERMQTAKKRPNSPPV